MNTPNLEELAVRCEKASGPDRELDAAIFRALAGNPSDHWYKLSDEYLTDDTVLPVTASLDAAMPGTEFHRLACAPRTAWHVSVDTAAASIPLPQQGGCTKHFLLLRHVS